MTPEIAQAIEIELTHIMKSDWVVTHQSDHISVQLPGARKMGTAELDEIWRIARFVSYSSFVSLEQSGDDKFIVTSRLPSGNGYTIIFSIRS